MKKEIYCFNNTWSPGQPRHEWNIGYALCEDGVIVGNHCSSSPEWCKIDITGQWKHAEFDKHCGKDNWEIVWIDDARNPEQHANEGFKAAVLAAKKVDNKVKPSVVVEMTDGTKITR